MKYINTMSTTDAAPSVDMTRNELEAWIRQGNCPFGVYIRREGSHRGAYKVFPKRLKAYVDAQDMQPQIA